MGEEGITKNAVGTRDIAPSDGRTLRSILSDSGRLSVRLASDVGHRVATIVAESSGVDALHVGLTPSNIVIEEHDDTRVASVRFEAVTGAPLTEENQANVAYTAPELFLFQDADSPAAKVYALGVILYEMCTGRPPFERVEGATLNHMMMQHVQESPPAMASTAPDASIPAELESLVLRCLEKEAEKRPSMHEVARELAALGSQANLDQRTDQVPALGIDSSAPIPDATLLSDVDKWWEFLDPATYQIDESAHSKGSASATADELDWTAVRKADRNGPVGWGFFHRCEDCGKSVPPDVTFCVHCGGMPAGFHTSRPFTIVVKRLDDERSRDDVIELLRSGSGNVDIAELGKIVDELPAIFSVWARKEQVAALVARMADAGIYAKSFPMDDPSVPWISETAQAIKRMPRRLAAAVAATTLVLLGTVYVSLAMLPFGLLGLAFLFKLQMEWFKGRYEFSMVELLNRVTGMDAGRAAEAAYLLKSLRDESIRGSLTVALMEFYTLHQSIQSNMTMYRSALEGTHMTLVELLDEILSACARFQRVEEFLLQTRPSELESRLNELKGQYQESGDADTRGYLKREIEAVQEQLRSYRRLESAREQFSERLQAMTRSLGALRARLDTVRANVSARWEDIPMDKILADLDDELVVFQQTFVEIEQAAPAMTVGR